MSFENQTVMVTGAACNLGQAAAAAFASQGARLVQPGRQLESLQAAFGDAGDNRLFLAADLLDGPQVAAALTAAVTVARPCHASPARGAGQHPGRLGD